MITIKDLEKLFELKQKGVITKNDFEEKIECFLEEIDTEDYSITDKLEQLYAIKNNKYITKKAYETYRDELLDSDFDNHKTLTAGEVEKLYSFIEKGIITNKQFNQIKNVFIGIEYSNKDGEDIDYMGIAKKWGIILCGIFIIYCFVSGTSDNLPKEVKEIAFTAIQSLKHEPYYNCLEKDVIKNLKNNLNLTNEELKSLTFKGRGGVEFMSVNMSAKSKIINTVNNTLEKSSCIQTWK